MTSENFQPVIVMSDDEMVWYMQEKRDKLLPNLECLSELAARFLEPLHKGNNANVRSAKEAKQGDAGDGGEEEEDPGGVISISRFLSVCSSLFTLLFILF